MIDFLFRHQDTLVGLFFGFLLLLLAVMQRRLPIFQYIFLCRIPLLSGLFLFGFPIYAALGAPALFWNLFVLDAVSISVVILFYYMAARVVFIVTKTICDLSPKELRDLGGDSIGEKLQKHRWLVSAGMVVTAICLLFIASEDRRHWPLFGIIAGGIACFIAELLAPHVGLEFFENQINMRLSFLREAWVSLAGDLNIKKIVLEQSQQIWNRLPLPIREAYLVQDDGRLTLRPEFTRSIGFFCFTIASLIILFLTGNPGENGSNVSALTYLLVLVATVTWILSGLAFGLDKLRIPVLAVVFGASFLVYWFKNTDHYFKIVSESRSNEARPGGVPSIEEALDAWIKRTKSDKPVLVVVGASGGGILTSAWVARVLTGLQEEFGDKFGRALFLISAVSGGGVGAMYFVDAYDQGKPPQNPALLGIFEAAASPSVNEIGWGLLFPDFFRLLPFPGPDETVDRAWALETSWSHRLRPDGKATLLNWSSDTREGLRPGVVFNATVVETGSRFLISTVGLPGDQWTKNFEKDFPSSDMAIPTAARLSATFPYVTPTARAWAEGGAVRDRAYHIADGGYYDTYGVFTLVQWLNKLDDKYAGKLGGVLGIVIRADSPLQSVVPDARRGWAQVLFGPLEALMNVRGATQIERADLDARLIERRWKGRLPVRFEEFVLKYDGPLSWKLTRKDKKEIQDEWALHKNGQGMRVVREWLLNGPPKIKTDCPPGAP